jgi:uncharacterized membrane protein YphA (DoxX/SURF4 family)
VTVQLKLRNVPSRLVTGAYILRSGWDKWHASEDTAHGLHEFASTAYPFLSNIPATTFARGLAAAELGIGAALLLPFVPNRIAGALLTGFSSGLVGLYWRAPKLREPGSVWPTHDGIAIFKDTWMVGIGAGLMLDSGASTN